MFYFFSKASWLFGTPMDTLLLFAVITTLYSALGASRRAAILAAIGILVFSIASFTPVGYLLMFPLENRFPRWQPGPQIPDGIIALGGEESARVTALVELGRRYPESRLFLLGIGKDHVEQLQAITAHLGGDPKRLVIESESRNTSENAVNAATIIRPHADQHWVLITSARHMPRAVGCFRADGFNVIPYPVDFTTKYNPPDGTKPIATAHSFTYVNLAIREWIGLIAYRLAGRTNDLWPGP
ncbi:Uncharacterized SAM-binding protein YcdF, DUF218 family [Rhizobiales bacterium GAS191]|nr:Uncharacterized SAM-binding protein YcdF, DUF218 family [Rhizobiales bacterium GAS191]